MQAKLQVACLTVVGGLLALPAIAQGTKAPDSPWSQTITKAIPGVEGQELDVTQIGLVEKVNGYFNQMGDMKGTFVQTSADNKRLRGKFYIKRPGQFRFEYNLPSRQIIVSDGTYMAIQDHDLKTDDRVGLDQTPFRVILRDNVDLLRDAKILEVGETDDRIVLALQDKSPDTQGRIKLFLQKQPSVELKEWITTDSQGQDTRIELTEFSRVESLDPKLFVPPPIALQKLQ